MARNSTQLADRAARFHTDATVGTLTPVSSVGSFPMALYRLARLSRALYFVGPPAQFPRSN